MSAIPSPSLSPRRKFAASARSLAAFDVALGTHCLEIAKACAPGGQAPRHLVKAASEVDPTSGGFLVEPGMSSTLLDFVYEETEVAVRCDRRTVARPGDVRLPGIDETSRAEGSRFGGAASFWAAESQSVSASLLKWKALQFSAHKLLAICVASNELLHDVSLLGGHLRRALTAELSFRLDAAVISGTGAGMPAGLVGHPATIAVAKETGQAAGTIVKDNIAKMWTRLPAPSRKRAVWLVNEQVEEALDAPDQASGPSLAALYMPAGVAGGNPYPLLKGRPVITIEQCPALGSPGDIILADLSHYTIVQSDIAVALSLHVRFDNDESKFRFVLRVDGMPALSAPITPFAGSSTRSPFVTLAAR